jgi:hypothetical protein
MLKKLIVALAALFAILNTGLSFLQADALAPARPSHHSAFPNS